MGQNNAELHSIMVLFELRQMENIIYLCVDSKWGVCKQRHTIFCSQSAHSNCIPAHFVLWTYF